MTLFNFVFGQNGFVQFSIPIKNESADMVYYRFSDFQDSIKPGKTLYIRQPVKKNIIPFTLFLYTKNSTIKTGLRSYEIRIMFEKVNRRKITITKNNKVIFSSNKSENLFDSYFNALTESDFWKLTDSVIIRNTNDIAAAEIIHSYLCRSRYSIDTIQFYFSTLSTAIQNSMTGQHIQSYIKGRKKLVEGTVISDFILIDSSNNQVKLSDIKSEFLLLDFWFSSCKPCIESFPSLLDLYTKTDRSKFEIVGISVDSKQMINNWKSAIKKHGLSWINLLDSEFNISYYTFSIESYPTKVLLNNDRVIIKINPDENEIERILNRK